MKIRRKSGWVKGIFISLVLLVILALLALASCRRVTIVSDSLLAGVAEGIVVDAINSNVQESWVYTEHIWSGSTAYNNPINHQIYDVGVVDAFARPDAVVFSFGVNDMSAVVTGKISYESAVQSMQTLINQAVAAGATCVILLEACHHWVPANNDQATFREHMDKWFNHWRHLVGDNEYLGIPYSLRVANISDQIHADHAKYISDYIHLTLEGAQLAATSIVEQINQCPEGRWIFGEERLKPDAAFPPNPYMEYKIIEE